MTLLLVYTITIALLFVTALSMLLTGRPLTMSVIHRVVFEGARTMIRPPVDVIDAIKLSSMWDTRRLVPDLTLSLIDLSSGWLLTAQVTSLPDSCAPTVPTLLRLWSSAVRAILTFLRESRLDSRDRDAMTRPSSIRLTVSNCVVCAVGCRMGGADLSTHVSLGGPSNARVFRKLFVHHGTEYQVSSDLLFCRRLTN